MFETASYLAKADGLLTQTEQDEVVEVLARDPTCGDVIVGSGGIRKMRFAFGHRGKSGGARVVYYFRDHGMPLYLLTLFAKNEKANLSLAELNALARLVKDLVRAHRKD